MDLVGVEEEEEALAAVVLQPAERAAELGAAALVLVDLEAVVESAPAVHVRAAGERRGHEAGVAQHLGERVGRGAEHVCRPVAPPEPDSMDAGVERGQHRHVRRRRLRRLTPGVEEGDALAGEAAIERRARRQRISPGAEAVGAQRVDRDEEQVRALRRAPRADRHGGAQEDDAQQEGAGESHPPGSRSPREPSQHERAQDRGGGRPRPPGVEALDGGEDDQPAEACLPVLVRKCGTPPRYDGGDRRRDGGGREHDLDASEERRTDIRHA